MHKTLVAKRCLWGLVIAHVCLNAHKPTYTKPYCRLVHHPYLSNTVVWQCGSEGSSNFHSGSRLRVVHLITCTATCKRGGYMILLCSLCNFCPTLVDTLSQAEQQWIAYFYSIYPHGYNARNAARGVDMDRLACQVQWYGTRDMCRSSLCCVLGLSQRCIAFETYAASSKGFANITTPVPERTLVFCRTGLFSRDSQDTDT